MKRIGPLVFGVGLAAVLTGAGNVMANRQAQPPSECFLQKKGAFSVGFEVEHNGERYRCADIFGDNLQRTGVAWIKVERKEKPSP